MVILKTSVSKDITNYQEFNKNEALARRWSYAQLIPVDKIVRYQDRDEGVFLHEITDDLNLPDQIVENAIYMYKLRGEL